MNIKDIDIFVSKWFDCVDVCELQPTISSDFCSSCSVVWSTLTSSQSHFCVKLMLVGKCDRSPLHMSHFIDSFHQIYPIRRGRMNDASQILIPQAVFWLQLLFVPLSLLSEHQQPTQLLSNRADLWGIISENNVLAVWHLRQITVESKQTVTTQYSGVKGQLTECAESGVLMI